MKPIFNLIVFQYFSMARVQYAEKRLKEKTLAQMKQRLLQIPLTRRVHLVMQPITNQRPRRIHHHKVGDGLTIMIS